MSATPDRPRERAAEIVAAALIRALSASTWAARRTYTTGVLGLGPGEIHAALAARLTADVEIEMGSGADPAVVGAINAGGNLLIPYLVTGPGEGTTENSGSSGFAATLRTQFLDRSTKPRVLLVLADRPDETVTTASDDAGNVKALRFPALADAIALERLGGPVARGTLLADVLTDLKTSSSSTPGWKRLERLDAFLLVHGNSSPAELGGRLHELGEYLSDPAATGKRLREGRAWRALIGAAMATPSRSLEHHLVKRRANPRGARLVADCAGPAGLDWTGFTLADLVDREGLPEPLGLASSKPVSGARLALNGPRGALVLWLPGGGGSFMLNLTREPGTGEGVSVAMTGAAVRLGALAGTTASFRLDAPGYGGWSFGSLHVGTGEPLPIAVTFSDSGLIAVEDGLLVDPASEAFLCGEDPRLRCWTPEGRDVGLAQLDAGGDDPDEVQHVTGTAPGGQPVGPVPVLAQGASQDGTEEAEAGDEEGAPGAGAGSGPLDGGDGSGQEQEPGEGGPGEDVAASDDGDDALPAHEHLTFPHAMLNLKMQDWPTSAGVNEEGELGAVVGTERARIRPRLGAVDLVAVERSTHHHPEWAQYQVPMVGPTPGPAVKLADLPDPQPGWAGQMAAFREARDGFFSAALQAGTAYAVDPRSAAASEYVRTYRELLWALPRSGMQRSEYDLLIGLDLVEVGGIRDLLISPMSPLSVAYHAALAARFAESSSGEEPFGVNDIASLRLQWVVPLLNLQGSWFESVPAEQAFLWRQYATLDDASQGSYSRSASFIRNRIQFFLAVHPHLAGCDNVIAVSCAAPGNGRPMLKAMRLLLQPELREGPSNSYSYPKFDITLAAPSADVRDTLGELTAGGRDHEVDRVIRTRCSIRLRDAPDPDRFSHLSFLFRTPGGRSTAPVDMGIRAPTTYCGGLATTPGRARIDDSGQVFATGVFDSEPAEGAGDLARIQYRTLELVGGQGGERLVPGGTRMVRARATGTTLDAWYEKSAWVVHLDRMIGIEAFADDSDRSILEYEDRAEPAAFGYDGITATRHLAPYLAALKRSVEDLSPMTEDQGRQVMSLLESVSGRWTLQIIQREIPKVRERVGTACAIDYIARAESTLPGAGAVSVLVALEEVVPGFPEPGIPALYQRSRRGKGPICDDLLLLTLIPRPGQPPVLSATVTEVKFTSGSAPDLAKAAGQVTETNQWLERRYGQSSRSRDLRGAELAELIRSAGTRNRAFAFGHNAVPTAGLGAVAESALAELGTGNYELVLGSMRGPRRRRGIVVSVEAALPGGPSLTQLNGPDGPLDLVTLGREWMRAVLSGSQPPRPRAWPALRPAAPEPPPQAPGGTGAPSPSDGGGVGPPGAARESGGGERNEGGTAASAMSARPRQGAADALVVEMAGRLDRAFARYGLPIEGFDPSLAQRGPSLTRFRTRGVGKLAFADVERRARDLAREVEAPGQLLVGDEPGFITVDVPRTDREMVPLAQLLPALESPSRPGALDFIAGVSPAGETRTADLSRLPHLLVAGATGSGKSVFLRGLLVELLRARTPEQLQLLIVDPKRLDFAPFARAEHHRGPILHDTDEALQTLQFTLGAEIDLRQPILQRAGASSASEFYEAGGSLEELPQLVIVIDEFADLVLAGSDRKAFSEMIQRYAQLTRAYGIFLVLATQRPSVDVVTGSIKANLTARMAFALPSYRDSMTILDRAGAEDLLGDGDMLFYRNGRVERLQAPFASLSDINQVLG